jgi:hypothetical protein
MEMHRVKAGKGIPHRREHCAGGGGMAHLPVMSTCPHPWRQG